jgi:hypothetical protein
MMRTAKTRKPACDSAATTAAVISRRLGKAGAPMSARDAHGRRTEGYYVRRVGCSSTVSVDYHCGQDVCGSRYHLPEYRERRRAAYVQLRHWATAQGYTMDNRGWTGNGCYIKCERE